MAPAPRPPEAAGLPGNRPAGLPGVPAPGRPPGLPGLPPRQGPPLEPAEAEDEEEEEEEEKDAMPGMGLRSSPLARPGIERAAGGLPARREEPDDEDETGEEDDEGDEEEKPRFGSPSEGLPLPRPAAPPPRPGPPGLPGSRPGSSPSPGPPRPLSRPTFGEPRPAPKPVGPAPAPEGENRRNEVGFDDDFSSGLDELRDAVDADEDSPSRETDRASPTASANPGLAADKTEAESQTPAKRAAAMPADESAGQGRIQSANPDAEATKDNGRASEPESVVPLPGSPSPNPTIVPPSAGGKSPSAPSVLPSGEARAKADTSPSPVLAVTPIDKPSRPARLEPSPSKADSRPEWVLPPVDEMLDSSLKKPVSDEELRQRAEIIEQTLSSFGAPGRVVEVNYGPVITQFGVEPDYIDGRAGKRIKVKVGKISSLADDLALALAAPTIRIEAPVPGKGYVGIEVPNAEPSLVALRDVVDTPEFRNLKSPLKLALGQDVSGQPVVADLTSMPHLLIAGTTGSGKSVCVNGIIATMLLTCRPDELKMIMVDPKRVELTNYNGIPHLMAPVVTELERIVGVLKWVQREMDDRYRKFAMAGARNIMDFNSRVEKGQVDSERLPYIIVIVDELADLMMLAPDETERVLTRLAQMARATGIHIIISTQRPSVDVVTGLIKANFPARIAFAVATGVDSRVILDMPGAEKLLGRGDMLFQAPDAPMPIRMQGVFVSDDEIQRIADYWRRQADEMSASRSPGLSSGSGSHTVSQRPLFSADDEDKDDDADDLFDEAVELVRDMEKASISLLQRHLRIGYTRAARLIDLMEERGVIGPHEGGSKPRTVLGPDGEPLGDVLDEEDEDGWEDEEG